LPAVPILAAVLLAVLWSQGNWFGGGALEITTSNIVQVTNAPGIEFQPAISPSGSEVAYVVGPLTASQVEVKSATEAGSSGATRPAELHDVHTAQWLPQWSKDGLSVRLRVCSLSYQFRCEWMQAGKYGGSTRTLSSPRKPSGPFGLPYYAGSPDGSRLVFAVGDSILAAKFPGGDAELLGIHTVQPWDPHSFTWSPDGRWIAYVNGNPYWRWGANVSSASVWILDAQGGEPIRITDQESLDVSPQWLPDSRHLLFVSNRDGPRAVYVVEISGDGPKGTPQHVPGPSDPHSISISSDGKRIAWAKLTVSQNVWSLPIPDSGPISIAEAVPVTDGNRIIEQHDLSWDGQWLVFDGYIQGKFGIFKRRLGGGGDEIVTEIEGHAFAPVWSPDGTEIAFYGGPDSLESDIFVVPASGGIPRRITDFPGLDSWPSWSPDGRTIAYISRGPQGNRPTHVWALLRDGLDDPWGDPVQLTDFECGRPSWAPNGRAFVCNAGYDDSLRVSRMAIVARSGEVEDIYEIDGGFASAAYSPDGSRIFFWRYGLDGSVEMRSIPSGGGAAFSVVVLDDRTKEMPGLLIGAPALTVGPKNLYVTISEYDSDIWVADLEW
jgi:TolB protein